MIVSQFILRRFLYLMYQHFDDVPVLSVALVLHLGLQIIVHVSRADHILKIRIK